MICVGRGGFLPAVMLALVVSLLQVVPAAAACDGRRIDQQVLNPPACVPAEPLRVVILDSFYNLGMALELGAPVVGAPLFAAHDARLTELARTAGVSDIGDFRSPSLERILALKPDLLIGEAQLHGALYPALSKIAPTVLIEAPDWKAHFMTLGNILGRTPAAVERLAAYEARVAAIRARVPDTTVSIIRIAPHGFHVYLDGPRAYAPYAVLREAGVKRTAYETTTDDTVLKRPDWEDIGALDGGILLYVAAAGSARGQDDALAAETVANPLWQMLPAVQAGRTHRLERGTWMGFNSLASAHRVLDDIERFILTTP
ncbi:iron ABC transporter permease [Azorhizobium oxalatiphilum]|uniref:Iron ABC transporter permease n=1 Tax=Azorhizobium oxalatiphilum TaxID=980631 RepID=A0A917C6L6_9HYPH|nr:iron-siderophore ABC transporter substrate-binding protein [Azorhizobium oxalatiphilum]GGF74703.1 iron ABC transporter permease [Azorhizobium oxalatiphilum]